jgi:hypothetical protein
MSPLVVPGRSTTLLPVQLLYCQNLCETYAAFHAERTEMGRLLHWPEATGSAVVPSPPKPIALHPHTRLVVHETFNCAVSIVAAFAGTPGKVIA